MTRETTGVGMGLEDARAPAWDLSERAGYRRQNCGGGVAGPVVPRRRGRTETLQVGRPLYRLEHLHRAKAHDVPVVAHDHGVGRGGFSRTEGCRVSCVSSWDPDLTVASLCGFAHECGASTDARHVPRCLGRPWQHDSRARRNWERAPAVREPSPFFRRPENSEPLKGCC